MNRLNKKAFLTISCILLLGVSLLLFSISRDKWGFVLGEFDDTTPPQLVSLEFSAYTINTEEESFVNFPLLGHFV